MKALLQNLRCMLGELLVMALIPGALVMAYVIRPDAAESVGTGPSAPSLEEAMWLIAEAEARRASSAEPPSPSTKPVDPRLQPAAITAVHRLPAAAVGVSRTESADPDSDLVPVMMPLHSLQ